MPLLISLLPFFICPYMMRSVEDYCRTNHTASSVTLAPATMTLPIVIHDLPVRHKHRLLCNIPYNPYLWYGNEATVLHILGQIWSTGNHSKEWLPFIVVDDQLGRVGRPLLSGILGIRQDSFYLWEARWRISLQVEGMMPGFISNLTAFIFLCSKSKPAFKRC